MSALLEAVVSWRTLLLSILVFGFAPGAALRIIVLAFHREDPRRQELLGEIYAVPRWERPYWVAQQLEAAIFEGLGGRIEWALTGRVIYRTHKTSGVKMNQRYPDSFSIPSEEEKDYVLAGDWVKICFTVGWPDEWGERMWVKVEKVGRQKMVGTLANQPIGFPRLDYGDTITFRREHIIDIDFVGDEDVTEVHEVA
ncbi:MAG TPA: DUF2314 domain-containing protein [Acidimicrobiales bacterium]|nr:DUF2314 domain-containing protein [Acidimicrobiales bacterium]